MRPNPLIATLIVAMIINFKTVSKLGINCINNKKRMLSVQFTLLNTGN
jgi:hypothetical protein